MKINYEGLEIECLDAFSQKDFTGRDLSAEEIPPGVIYQSCFSQEKPGSVIFPVNLFGVTFINCNLDNVYVPPTCQVLGGSAKQFAAQNDLRDWEVDENGKPIRLVNEESEAIKGNSIDPRDIPKVKIASIDDVPKARVGFLARVRGLWR